MSDILRGCGLLCLLFAGYWTYVVFTAMGPSPSDMMALAGILRLAPTVSAAGAGVLFISAGTALDYLWDIRREARKTSDLLASIVKNEEGGTR